jgi:hypothetical protein
MRLASSSPRHVFAILLTSIFTAAIFSTGCGSSSSMAKIPPLTGNTAVTVVVSSTANDQLAEFDLGFQGITLTGQSGNTATLLSAPTSGPGVSAEFMHINGTAEPLMTATIPQDVYTSATVSLSDGLFVCIALGPSDGQETLSSAFYSLLPPTSAVTVTLPSPITVTGASMALSLNLIISQSATIGDCVNVDGFNGFSMTPTFNLTPLSIAASPTSAANGKVTGLDGQIAAMGSGGNSFTLSVPSYEGLGALSISSGNGTVYQGISNFSALAVGTFVDMDGAIQQDGSLLATRVAVEDPSAVDIVRGPLMEVTPSVSITDMHAREQQGKDIPGYIGGFGAFDYSSASFQISGQLPNLGNLPFVPSFNASNMVPGQEVYISAATIPNGGYPVATTMTLMPQTINGTVMGSSMIGNFTDYTVSLASYDLFPMLAVQPDQTTVENNPSQVEVYVDSNTQLLNTQALASGSTLRFYGLVFNDNGTLRMDCAQVNDGVAFTTQPSSAQQAHTVKGEVQEIRRQGSGSLEQTINLTRQP